jgi:phosphoribosylglycinamide formyltransferase-1
MPLPIAVLVSGSGSNLQSIIDKIETGVLDAEIKLVLSNKEGVYGVERAKKHGVPTAVAPHKDFDSREDFDRAMMEKIDASGAEAVVLAGFMRLLTAPFVQHYEGRLVNIHPALLPSFPGAHGQPDAAEYGVTISGCTVHFVDEQMDHGPIIIQAAVPAFPGEGGDALGARILEFEHRVFPQAIQWLAQGRLRIEGRRVHLRDAGRPEVHLDKPGLVNPPLEEGF